MLEAGVTYMIYLIGSIALIMLVKLVGLMLYARFFPYQCYGEINHFHDGRELKNKYKLEAIPDWRFNMSHVFRYRFYINTPFLPEIYVIWFEKIGDMLKCVAMFKPVNSKLVKECCQNDYKLKYNFLEIRNDQSYEIEICVEQK